MIDPKTLRSLIKLMVDNDLTELDLRDQDETVTLKRSGDGSFSPVVSAPAHAAPAPPPPSEPAPSVSSATADDGPAVESPMVGTFYASSDPDSPPFVQVGDKVSPDTVVCIIEAMKVFNEVKAGVSGVIERVLVDNAQPVEFGQKLFAVKPG